MIYICSLFELEYHFRLLRPGYLISLVQPEFQPPTPSGLASDRHLRVAFHDVSEPVEGAIAPDERHIDELVRFLQGWPGDEALLMHCYAGVSRSTAGALIALALDLDGRELEAARLLREAAPHAHPNFRMIVLADQVLGREGRLIAAREAMGPGRPVLEGPLVELPPLR